MRTSKPRDNSLDEIFCQSHVVGASKMKMLCYPRFRTGRYRKAP